MTAYKIMYSKTNEYKTTTLWSILRVGPFWVSEWMKNWAAKQAKEGKSKSMWKRCMCSLFQVTIFCIWVRMGGGRELYLLSEVDIQAKLVLKKLG